MSTTAARIKPEATPEERPRRRRGRRIAPKERFGTGLARACTRRPRRVPLPALERLERAGTPLEFDERDETIQRSGRLPMSARTARILLVDDEQPVQKLLTYPLQKEGYEVVQALDGQQALSAFEEQQFDLVVLDIMLPRVDGLEVCKRLRAKSRVPIIMLTAKAEEIDKVLGL